MFQKYQLTNRNLKKLKKRWLKDSNKLISIKGKQTAASFHKRLGKIMWDYCGMIRNEEGSKKSSCLIKDLKEEFWKDLNIPGNIGMN